MRTPVTHINLLQRSGPAHTMAWGLAGLLCAALTGVLVHGIQLHSLARDDLQRRDVAAAQLKQAQARLAALSSEQAKNADALALRKEIEALQPQAQAAQSLLDAIRNADSGRTDEFARPLAAMTAVSEPGLWLTTLTVTAGGRKVELQGEARSGASVLRFARRANDALRPLTLHLDSLEMQPAAGVAATPETSSGAVSFRLF